MSGSGEISVDFSDKEYLKQFIEAYKDRTRPMQGQNTSGEFVIIGVSATNVHVQTFQLDNSVRHNIYRLDGTIDEWFENESF